MRLAISLHAADDRTRGALMPINARYPIASLLAAARRYCDSTGRRVFIEYLLLDGVNDAPADARRLAGLLRDGRFHVNVIEYNPTDGGYRASPRSRREAFLRGARRRGPRGVGAPLARAPTSRRPAASSRGPVDSDVADRERPEVLLLVGHLGGACP